MYAMRLPEQSVKAMYALREEHGKGSIARQVRTALNSYLAEQEKELGRPIIKVEEKNN